MITMMGWIAEQHTIGLILGNDPIALISMFMFRKNKKIIKTA